MPRETFKRPGDIQPSIGRAEPANSGSPCLVWSSAPALPLLQPWCALTTGKQRGLQRKLRQEKEPGLAQGNTRESKAQTQASTGPAWDSSFWPFHLPPPLSYLTLSLPSDFLSPASRSPCLHPSVFHICPFPDSLIPQGLGAQVAGGEEGGKRKPSLSPPLLPPHSLPRLGVLQGLQRYTNWGLVESCKPEAGRSRH